MHIFEKLKLAQTQENANTISLPNLLKDIRFNLQHIQQHKTLTCHECALPVAVPILLHKQKAHCPRCGLQLSRFHQHSFEYVLAFAVTALIFLMLSVPFDFLSFSARGQQQSMNITQGLTTLVENDYFALALIQLLAIFAIPLTMLLGLLYLLLPIRFLSRPPRYARSVFKLVTALIPWSMAEIFLIGVLVSLIKLTSMADVAIGGSFYAYILFTVFMTLSIAYTDKHQLQQLLSLPHHHQPPSVNSIQHTWALLVTAFILYIPASFLPIMNTRLLGQDSPSTIMGGVIVLWEHGDYPIALVIFVASVFVPIAKLGVLCWLNHSVQAQKDGLQSQRTRLYRITEFIGRWSMIDVFVVAVLVSLIQLGNTMRHFPRPCCDGFFWGSHCDYAGSQQF